MQDFKRSIWSCGTFHRITSAFSEIILQLFIKLTLHHLGHLAGAPNYESAASAEQLQLGAVTAAVKLQFSG